MEVVIFLFDSEDEDFDILLQKVLISKTKCQLQKGLHSIRITPFLFTLNEIFCVG